MKKDIVITRQKISQEDDQFTHYTPVRVVEIELAQPFPVISASDEKGTYYQRARCLVRLHANPIGLVDLKIETDKLSPVVYASEIWQALNEQINTHLRQDGLPLITELTATGLPFFSTPSCIEGRE